jgi:hypothetical protein
VCNIINDVIADIDWINVMVNAPNQSSSLNYWLNGNWYWNGVGQQNINKVVLAYFAKYSDGQVYNCKTGSACPSKSDCKCNCSANTDQRCFYQASGIQLAKEQNILGISFWNTQTTEGSGGSYSGCTLIDPIGFKEGLDYLVNDKMPLNCPPATTCPSCDSPSQTCCGECKTGCCQGPNNCNKTLVKSQCGPDWTWCG